MSSALQAHRAAIVAALSSVPNIGVVHDRERYAKDNAKFAQHYLFTPAGGQQQLRGWWVRRAETEERSDTYGSGTTTNVHTWHIRGYLGFNDEAASELAFDELIEAFRAVVRDDPTLGGACEQPPEEETDGVQLMDAGPVMFAGVLCHSALLQLKTGSYL
ncbi:MAG: hypothetical protein K2X78_01230 [Burkholderiaceae bacterium]|nr:hypothetical protein [Burkholderiaceae bacterium]